MVVERKEYPDCDYEIWVSEQDGQICPETSMHYKPRFGPVTASYPEGLQFDPNVGNYGGFAVTAKYIYELNQRTFYNPADRHKHARENWKPWTTASFAMWGAEGTGRVGWNYRAVRTGEPVEPPPQAVGPVEMEIIHGKLPSQEEMPKPPKKVRKVHARMAERHRLMTEAAKLIRSGKPKIDIVRSDVRELQRYVATHGELSPPQPQGAPAPAELEPVAVET